MERIPGPAPAGPLSAPRTARIRARTRRNLAVRLAGAGIRPRPALGVSPEQPARRGTSTMKQLAITVSLLAGLLGTGSGVTAGDRKPLVIDVWPGKPADD